MNSETLRALPMRRLAIVVASLLSTVAQAFSPITWAKFPGEEHALMLNKFAEHNLRTFGLPQELTLGVPGGGKTTPYFTPKSDNTISVGGWCVEAAGQKTGDAVLVKSCNGGPAQQWNWIPDSHGRNMIQLKDSNKCLGVIDQEGGLRGARIELQECENKASEAWRYQYEAAMALPEESALNVRYVHLTVMEMAGIGALSFVAWIRQRHAKLCADRQSSSHRRPWPAMASSDQRESLEVECIAFPLPACTGLHTHVASIEGVDARAGICTMLAKKRTKSRKNKRAAAPSSIPATARSSIPASAGEPLPQSTSLSASSRRDPKAPLEDRMDKVLRSKGIAPPTDGRTGAADSGDILSRIPKKGQELLEKLWLGGAILCGSIFLLSGLGLYAEGIFKTLERPMPTQVVEAIDQYLNPVLTPSLGLTFFFSANYGILKQLQLNSEGGNVFYQEDDD